MLNSNVQMRFSEFHKIYDFVVPRDYFLRRVKEEIDFSFVNDLLKSSYCEHFGRPAKEPEMMFKFLFLKKLEDLSDAALIEQVRMNMGYKFFLDMLPEDEPIDPSLLTKFRKTRITQDILEDLLKETIAQAIAKGLIKSTAIIVDATHTHARYKHQSPTEILRKMSRELRREIYSTDYELSASFPEKPSQLAELSEEIEYTRELVKATKPRIAKRGSRKAKELLAKIEGLLTDERIRDMQSVCDEEARTGHKSAEDRFFGYKNHIAITEKERLITAIKITDGSQDDGRQLPDLIKQSKENGIEVKEVLGDTAYASGENLALAESQGAPENAITLVSKLHPMIAEPHTKERKGFLYNKDADTYICPAGHTAKSCQKYKSKKNNNTVLTYSFSKVICKKCPLRNSCLISEKSRAFSVTVPKPIHQKQLDFQKTDEFKDRYRQRYKIEAKNAEAKRFHGLGHADSKGIQAMNVQSYCTAFVLNIKRILKLQTLKAKNEAV
jgi:transposase